MMSQHPSNTELIRYPVSAATDMGREASRAGRWALWFGCLVSGIWFGLVGMLAFATPILDGFKQDIYLFGALLVALAMPGVLLFFSGLFARAQSQTSAANTLVLEAANQLLLPSASVSDAATTHAQRIKGDAESIERAVVQAMTVLDSFVGELDSRRIGLFEATGNTVEKTEAMIDRLGQERAALTNLTGVISTQLDDISVSIPRQANKLAEAMKSASDDVLGAESALNNNMSAFKQAEDRLLERMREIDSLAQSTASYAEKLGELVHRIETRLTETTRLIDASVKAGELASTAAETTGQALNNAVSAALDGARLANDEIAAKTIATARNSVDVITALRRAARQANTEFSVTKAKAAQIDVAPEPAPTPASRAPLQDIAPPPPEDDNRPSNVTPLGDVPDWVETLSKHKSRRSQDPTDTPIKARDIAPTNNPNVEPTEDYVDDIEADLLEDVSPVFRADILGCTDDMSVQETSEDKDNKEDRGDKGDLSDLEPSFIIADLDSPTEAPIRLSRLSEVTTHDIPEPIHNALLRPDRAQSRTETASWGNILADVDRIATQSLPPREETAEQLVIAFEKQGLELHKIFKPKEKKRIAVAARRGDYARRSAIKECARRYVTVTEAVLVEDRNLLYAAEAFLEHEHNDALQALEKTHKTNKNAGIRLAVFLLVDAAVGKARAA